MSEQLKNYIKKNFSSTIRVSKEDKDSLIGLPFPYTAPCKEDRFQEMYYWDTYFTNLSLLRSDLTDKAKNNAEDMAFLIEKYEFMSNGKPYLLSFTLAAAFFHKNVQGYI